MSMNQAVFVLIYWLTSVVGFTQALGTSGAGIAQLSNEIGDEKSAEVLLQRGLYFSDLYNWSAARPYLVKSQQLFEINGDHRCLLYAQLAAIRAGTHSASLPQLSEMISRELRSNPILETDKELRMFSFVVKGELDGEIDSIAMRRDWAEVSRLAHELGNPKWEYRAQGQIGFADFYDGDLSSAQKNVAEALIGATRLNDIGGQIFYLSTTAEGFVDK